MAKPKPKPRSRELKQGKRKTIQHDPTAKLGDDPLDFIGAVRESSAEPRPEPTAKTQPAEAPKAHAEPEVKSFGTRLPADLIQELRVHCAVTGISQQDFVEQALRAALG